jgi:xylitol oxidase
MHPVPGQPAEACTEQFGRPGPWNARLPHFRLEFTPSAGEEMQSEYFVLPEDGAAAFAALQAAGPQLADALMVSEVRAIAADELWLSPMYGSDVVAFHFTWVDDWAKVDKAVAVVEQALAPYGPRTHWGKLFQIEPAQLQARYPRLDDFRGLVRECDPEGKFANDFTRRYVLED